MRSAVSPKAGLGSRGKGKQCTSKPRKDLNTEYFLDHNCGNIVQNGKSFFSMMRNLLNICHCPMGKNLIASFSPERSENNEVCAVS